MDKLYAMYLRKSRADLDAEARGEGETLGKHRAALTGYARRRGLQIGREYAEIVSGDSIAARPQMQQLLTDVKAGLYAGVLVNDVDRLGRGDSIDQEIIKLTFAASHTLIITPDRDIDPSNPTDDDMLDFSMFLARFEYKKIAQRLKQGKIRSAAAGRWTCGSPPYGYNLKDGKLIPDPETAPIVRMIYDWYGSGEIGIMGICRRLADMGIRLRSGKPVDGHSLRGILRNHAYIGRIRYGETATVSVIEDGRRVKKRIRSTPTIIEGTHEPIVSMEEWEKVQIIGEKVKHVAPVNSSSRLVNPLAGLVYCAECGKAMKKVTGAAGVQLLCPTYGCPTCGSYLASVESAILDTLRGWCAAYADPDPEQPREDPRRAVLAKQIDQVSTQIERAQELVELGVYSAAEYVKRRDALKGRLETLSAELDKLTAVPDGGAVRAILPAVRHVLDAYPSGSVEQKNALLKSVVDRVIYHKTRAAQHGEDPALLIELDVFPLVEPGT